MSIRTNAAVGLAAAALLSVCTAPAAFADVSDVSDDASCQAVVTTTQIDSGLLTRGQLADSLHLVGARAFADYQVYLAHADSC